MDYILDNAIYWLPFVTVSLWTWFVISVVKSDIERRHTDELIDIYCQIGDPSISFPAWRERMKKGKL